MRRTGVFDWLNTEQTAVILSSVLHNMVSNSTVFCAFLVRRFMSCKLSNLKYDSVYARDARAVKKIAFRLT